MSKRDALKKLRQEQKPISTGDTPAEEYSKLAAEASNQEFSPESIESSAKSKKIEIRANNEVKDSIKAIAPIDVIFSTDIPNSEEPTEPMAKAIEINALDKTNSEAMKEDEDTEVEEEDEADPFIEEDSKEPEVTDVSQDNTEVPKTTIRKTKTSYKSVAQEAGKRISISLKIENNNWMRRTAMRCGLSIQDYMNILLDEAWAREKRSPYVLKDTDPLPERIPSNKTILVAIKLTDNNINRSKRLRATHCMTMTSYMNYLIQEEMKREEKYGIRAAIFDED